MNFTNARTASVAVACMSALAALAIADDASASTTFTPAICDAGNPADLSTCTVSVANPGTLGLTVYSSAATSGGTGTIGALAIPGSYGYSNGYTKQSSPFSGSFGFYDDYVFTIAQGQVDSVSSSVTLGSTSNPTLDITGLQARIYSFNANGIAPLTGSAVSGTVEQGWSSTTLFPGGGGGVNETVIAPVTLSAGTYVLEIRGTADGSAGGTYSGNIAVAAVPLPAGLPLLAGGLTLVAGLARRRRR